MKVSTTVLWYLSPHRELNEDIADINFEGEEKGEKEEKSEGSSKIDVGAMIEAELLAARERAKKEREEREEEERSAHVRPWDRGKGEGRKEGKEERGRGERRGRNGESE